MIIYLADAMRDLRRCLAVYDEFECTAYLNRTYGTWFLRVGNDVARSILDEASRSCTQVEGSFLYCIFCLGSQCGFEPSEVSVRYVGDCLDRLASVDSGIRNAIKGILSKALEVGSEVVCSGE